MVVKNLWFYVENIPGAFYSANLKELIKCDLDNGEVKPIIVLDSSSVLPDLDSPKFAEFRQASSQAKIFKRKIEKFVEEILSCGASLIVVLRFSTPNIQYWYFKNINDAHKNWSENFLCNSHIFFSISKNGYTVFRATESTHKEVVEIVRKQNIFAVIGQDSNYLIYPGIKFFISTKSVNFETLDCRVYERNKLLQELDLKSYQLPLFATLCGNDIVNFELLTEFHKRVKLKGNKFSGIACQIKHTTDDPYKHVKEVVELVHSSQVNEELISESLDMYLNFNKKSLFQRKSYILAADKLRNNKIYPPFYRILTLKEFRTTRLFHFKKKYYLCPTLLMRPLRQKIYGILFNHDHDRMVKEYCLTEMVNVKRKKFEPTLVNGLKPKCKHPGFMQLWSEKTSHLVKWQLFCSPFEGNLNQRIIRCVPVKVLLPVVALHYLYFHVPILCGIKIFEEHFELEALLVAALLVSEDLDEKLLSNEKSISPDRHVFYLINCLNEAWFTLVMLNQSCGLVVDNEKSCICNFLNGLLIHHVYKKMKDGANWREFFDGELHLEVKFSTFMNIIKGKSL